jgi:protein subunit release factor A
MPLQLYIFVNGQPFHEGDGVSESMTGLEIAGLVGISAEKASVRRDFKINPKDLSVDTFRPSKSAHQTLDVGHAAVRIMHLPTGLVVSSDEERSQTRNRAKAVRLSRERLSELGHAKPRPIEMNERVQIESGDSFHVTSLPGSR